jgi:XisH protein
MYHAAVVHALTADGWTITHDPLRLTYGDQRLYVDLGAERPTLGAEKAGRKIAVEIQSFLGRSHVRDLQEALGQYEVYRILLRESEPDRQLYMAVTDLVHDTVLSDRFGRFIVSRTGLRILVFDEERERITQWIEPTNTA